MNVNQHRLGIITISKERNAFIAFFINLGMINEIIGLILRLIIGNQPEFLSTLFKVEWIIVFLISFYLIAKDTKRLLKYIGCMVVWAILFAVSLTITPDLRILIVKCSFYTVICVITLAFLLSICESPETLITKLSSYIWLAVIYAILTNISFSINGIYSMQYTYSIIITLMAYFFTNRTRALSWLTAAFLVITVIRCGSRGGLLCLVIALLLYIMVCEKTSKKIVSIVMGGLVVAVLLLNFSPIMIFLSKLFPTSRTISYFAKGDVFYMSGRNIYYESITNAIENSHWKFHGLYSDRIFLGHLLGAVTPDDFYGNYTHNIFMEMCYQFGWIGILMLLILVISVIAYGVRVRWKNDSLKFLYVIAVSYAFGQLCFSSSYLTASSFGVLVGVMLLIKNYQEKVL